MPEFNPKTPWRLHTDGVITCSDGLSPNSTKRSPEERLAFKRFIVQAANARKSLEHVAGLALTDLETGWIENPSRAAEANRERLIRQLKKALETSTETGGARPGGTQMKVRATFSEVVTSTYLIEVDPEKLAAAEKEDRAAEYLLDQFNDGKATFDGDQIEEREFDDYKREDGAE